MSGSRDIDAKAVIVVLHDLQVIGDLVDGDGSIIQINDKKLASTLRLKLKFTDTQMLDVDRTS